jgi:hypothetical protein
MIFTKSEKNLIKGKCEFMFPKRIAAHMEFMVLLVTLLGGFYLLDGKIERQSERTDKLYEMFIDLVKENRRC